MADKEIMAGGEVPVASKRIITVLEIILAILAFYGAYRFASAELAQIKQFIVASGPYGILLSMIVLGLLGATPIPAEPFTILLSTIYGPFWAMIATSIGTLLSALVEYFISSRIGNAANFDNLRQKLPFGLGKFPVDSPAFLIGARVVPGYGSKFVSLISGFYRVPIFRYIWTTFIATLVGAAITSYGGFKIVELLTHVVK
jgi:uncharacterized membrane protein YdjX (TVP38/TMEM64 family)